MSEMSTPFDLGTIDGEPVVFQAHLTPNWLTYRRITCGAAMSAGGYGFFLMTIPYCLCGGSCRDEEARTFYLALTPTALHFKQKLYDCGCCCQRTITKTIPLDKIQDIMLIGDCCGDFCEFVNRAGAPYQIHVQTAGANGPQGTAELSVFCIEDPDKFRSQVLSAKRALTGLAPLGDAGIGGAGKDGRAIPAAPGVAAASAGGYYTNPVHGPGAAAMPVPGQGLDTRAVVQVLERIENAINDGIGVIRAQQALQAQLVQPAQMQMPQAPMQFNGAGKTI